MKSPHCPAQKRQRGEINLPRLFTIIAIFVAILMVPLYFLKKKAQAKPRVPSASAPAAASDAEKP
jgi:uncharacterized protein (UPF0333 family)